MKGKSRVMSKDASKTMKMQQHRVKNSDLSHIHRSKKGTRKEILDRETLVDRRGKKKKIPPFNKLQ